MKLIGKMLKLTYFYLTNRFILFFVLLLISSILSKIFTGNFIPTTNNEDLWFYSGLSMVIFSIFFIDPYYTSPKNVITNTIPLLLVFISINQSFLNKTYWNIGLFFTLTLLIFSILSMTLEDLESSPNSIRNKIARLIKNVATIFGRGKVFYSIAFVFFFLSYHSVQDYYTFALFVFWFFVMILDPSYIHNKFFAQNTQDNTSQIGEIFGIQSKNVFLTKLFKDQVAVRKFDIVKFKYLTQNESQNVCVGIVFDTYLLNQERWAKILELKDVSDLTEKLEPNFVYKISDKKVCKKLLKELNIDNFTGIVIDNSNIGKIRFEYSKKENDLQEGDLVELKINEKRLFYQVVSGTTDKDKLEARNETGFINGEAIQLGEWDNNKLSFQKFGWVPAINTAVFKSSANDISIPAIAHPLYKLGYIPGTGLPSVINLDLAVTHHTALLGITGSGKSYIARDLINQIKSNTKIVCVDFNKEFVSTLSPAPANIINDDEATIIASDIDLINSELDKFANQQNKILISTKQDEVKSKIKTAIDRFLDDNSTNIKVFELPDVSNTTGILDYTRYFFRVLFEVAKERQLNGNPAKICVVLEEAHTIIPEWNFSGSSDKTSQALVNSIGQITLQGRKYGVGFFVIAQRTANVSKTVLTQCNTVICFQAFDETSFSFLGNYVGKDMVQALPNLKQYHAVIAGKAVKSNMPMIIDLTRTT